MYRPHMCCVCQERESKYYRSWLCGRCYYENRELQCPVSEWPAWGKALKAQEERERRLARRTPYTVAGFNLFEGEPNADATGPNADYREADSEQVHTPLESWGETLRADLGDKHGVEAELLAAQEAQDGQARVRRALDEMAPEDRRVLELRYYRDPPCTQSEIAVILGVSQSTARNRLHDATIRLAARLKAPKGLLEWHAAKFGRNLARVLAKVR